MSNLHDRTLLRDIAFLYIAMGHGTDNYLSDAELQTITERLNARKPELEREMAREIVVEALTVYLEAANALETTTDILMALRHNLQPEQREAILSDLLEIAEADGIVLDNERGLLASLAECWGIVIVPRGRGDAEAEAGVLFHLAFIYLVLAHGTDNELSDGEVRVILKKLREWEPGHTDDEVKAILEAAKQRYGRGPNENMLAASIEAVKKALPTKQRMAALNDLVKIANADGVFLDDEEDLINTLLTAWEIDPYANYGGHGSKE